MKEIIKQTVRKTPLYDPLRKALTDIKYRRTLHAWQKQGKPIPAPTSVKQRIVKSYAEMFSIRTFVETGTLAGDMIYANKDVFGRIFSVELDSNLYERAKTRFSECAHISIIQGDSGEVLPTVLEEIAEPCLFWLDGHYSGGTTAKGKLETPIERELNTILSHEIAGHVVLIDDARHFVGENDYPTIEELKNLIFEQCPEWIFEVKDDIIRTYKERTNRPL